ncbi:MAG: 6-phosphogluconolactonase, partial [Muribaculaceae bacterium]|nr:6-phosphogluconolactonase [Muribaculaceae bacterium]
MKTNLSSQIKLDRTPKRYYQPEGDLERTALTREERVYTKIFETVNDGTKYMARKIVEIIHRNVAQKGRCVLALSIGANTHQVYAELIELYKKGEISFSKVIVFNLCEFFPVTPESPSTLKALKNVFLDHIDINPRNIHSFDSTIAREDMYHHCKEYEQEIANAGGLDLTICQLGYNGMLGFNEPGSIETSMCRLVLLSNNLRHQVASDFRCDVAPTTGVTLGIKNILASERIIAIAWGEKKAGIVKKTIEEPASSNVPASFLQHHDHVRFVLDLPAAEELTRISHPWRVTSCEWDDKLIRRAIIWLSDVTGKPILKLTNKDYTDYELGELLAIYGSAYNVNIKIFNDLQRTITGWPGGKPNADDTNRP